MFIHSFVSELQYAYMIDFKIEFISVKNIILKHAFQRLVD